MRISYKGSEYEVTDKSVQRDMLANGGVEVVAEIATTEPPKQTKADKPEKATKQTKADK